MALPLPSPPAWSGDPLVAKLIAAAAVVVAVSLLIRVSQVWLGRSLKDADTRYYARKLVALSGYFLVVVGITVIFKDRLGGLTVAIGVAGAGIAFALQEVIGSVAGWIAISFGGFYRPGDRVQVGGIKGDVIDIGILRTTLMELGEWVHSDLYSGRIVRVANSFVFKQPVFNYSGDFPFLWDELTLPVQYGSDHRLVRRILEGIGAEIAAEPFTASVRSAWGRMVKKYLIENAGVEPQITLVLTDNWMEFTLRYVVDVKARRSTKDHIYTRILEEFDRAGDRARIASATVQLVQPPPLEVRLRPTQPD
ncbi:mechanosensitive ion channel family protein [Cyanobium sp. CH-040]|uniref:mechanosensitive ion channel family protein n=1 Tax=Cyanobium sp. CH-040 TaxID=2823708 RepID=UPI0020CD88F2|nr:mechanosensitive ion channel domain-containing protein [Cyanobium sp. CH-040]MCP9928150.1 mechanosensitive ion channel [Cyanobium sp. CH-040]